MEGGFGASYSSLPKEGNICSSICSRERLSPSRDKGLARITQRWESGQAPERDFPQQREPEAAGSDSVGHGPQMEPSWASGAAAGEGGAAQGPAVPWGRLRAQTLGTRRRAGGRHPAGTFPGCRSPQAPGPGRAGAGWLRQRGCGCVSGLPSRPLSGLVSRPCSPVPLCGNSGSFCLPSSCLSLFPLLSHSLLFFFQFSISPLISPDLCVLLCPPPSPLPSCCRRLPGSPPEA